MRPNWFIGFPIESASWLETAQAGAPDGYRLFKEADLHLTLAFLGAIDRESAEKAWQTAWGCACSFVEITLGKLEAFGPRRRPSAFSFIIEQGREELIGCMEICQPIILQAVNRAAEKWPSKYRPHVTIARPPRNADTRARKAGLQWARTVSPPAFPIQLDRLALFTWAEDRRVRQFQIVEERALE